MLILNRMMQVESVHRDGTVIFQDGSGVLADVIMHCTGYAPICFTSTPQSYLALNHKVEHWNQ